MQKSSKTFYRWMHACNTTNRTAATTNFYSCMTIKDLGATGAIFSANCFLSPCATPIEVLRGQPIKPFVTEEILRIMARLHTRKFGQASILLQTLSSHPNVFIMFLRESMNFHPDKQLFPSCRRRGLNRWPLDYKASALPLHHGGPTWWYNLIISL